MPIAHPDVEPSTAFPRTDLEATTSTDSCIVIRNEDSVDHHIYLRLEGKMDVSIEQFGIACDSQRMISVLEPALIEIELYTDHDCVATVSFNGEHPSSSFPEFTIRSKTIAVGGLQ